jgi:hypothetical protein|tara:strand:+ start:5337 stop:5795 length:459 start_codon:yes stop_codon:yes gene_type:complete
MKTKKLHTIVLAFAFAISPIQASELTQEFSNPSFSGIGQSNHYLATEQLQYQRKEEKRKEEERKQRDAERDEANEVINKFIANVESRIYANLSKQLVDNMFSDSGADTGTAEIEGATIYWERDVDLGEISIRITEADGTVTTLKVPVGDFGF